MCHKSRFAIHQFFFLENYPRQDTHLRVRVRQDPFRLPPRPTQWCSRCKQRDHTRTVYTASTTRGAPEYTLKRKESISVEHQMPAFPTVWATQ